MTDEQPATRQSQQTGEDGEQPDAGEYRALIRALLRQTPEERILGLRRAATFFGAARRV